MHNPTPPTVEESPEATTDDVVSAHPTIAALEAEHPTIADLEEDA